MVFVGKLLAITNFAYRYKIYDNIVDEIDKKPMTTIAKKIVFSYLVIVYVLLLFVITIETMQMLL